MILSWNDISTEFWVITVLLRLSKNFSIQKMQAQLFFYFNFSLSLFFLVCLFFFVCFPFSFFRLFILSYSLLHSKCFVCECVCFDFQRHFLHTNTHTGKRARVRGQPNDCVAPKRPIDYSNVYCVRLCVSAECNVKAVSEFEPKNGEEINVCCNLNQMSGIIQIQQTKKPRTGKIEQSLGDERISPNCGVRISFDRDDTM